MIKVAAFALPTTVKKQPCLYCKAICRKVVLMAWQDIVITIVQISLAGALLPSVFKKDGKPALATSIMTSMALAVLSITFATLSLWFSAASTLVAAAIWVVLGVQRAMNNRRIRD